MQELKSIRDITYNKAGLVFGKVHPFLNVRQKWSAIDFFEDQIKSIQLKKESNQCFASDRGVDVILVGLFEELNQLNDISVSLTVIEDFNFPEHSGTVMSWDFVDNFDGILLARVVVLALLDRCIRPFAQEITGEGIEVGEGISGETRTAGPLLLTSSLLLLSLLRSGIGDWNRSRRDGHFIGLLRSFAGVITAVIWEEEQRIHYNISTMSAIKVSLESNTSYIIDIKIILTKNQRNVCKRKGKQIQG